MPRTYSICLNRKPLQLPWKMPCAGTEVSWPSHKCSRRQTLPHRLRARAASLSQRMSWCLRVPISPQTREDPWVLFLCFYMSHEGTSFSLSDSTRAQASVW